VIVAALALILFGPGELLYPLVAELNDEPEVRGVRLSNPTDALFVDGVLYVADGNAHTVFVLGEDGRLSRFGRAGSGPGELQHMPNMLSVSGETLVVTEWNWLYTSTFSMDGEFLSKTKRPDEYGVAHELGIRRLSHQEVEDTGFMLYDAWHDCYFSHPGHHPEQGMYLAAGSLHEDNQGRLYVIQRAGLIEVYERPCEPVATMRVPLGRFRADVKPHPVLRKIMKAAGSDYQGPVFVHGRPIHDEAVAGINRVWLLVKDEHLEKAPFYQYVREANTWLYEVDPKNQRIQFSMALDLPVHRIRYHDDHLILISGYEATVRVYRVE